MPVVKVKKGDQYKLPANGFTAPNGKEFAGWNIGGVIKQPGDDITVSGNIEVKAIWKEKKPGTTPSEEKVNISFNPNGGNGEMEGKELNKGSNFTLPSNGFTAPDGKEFDYWEIGGLSYKPGDEITVSGNIEVKAIWKDKDNTPPTPQPGGDSSKPINPNKPVEPGKPGEKPVEPGKPIEPGKPGETPSKPGEKPAKPGSEEPGKAGERIPVPKVTERKEQAENKAKNANPNVKTGVESLSLVTASLVSAASALFMTFKKKKND